MASNMTLVGWRCWFWNGDVVEGATGEEAYRLAGERPDGMLVRMLYYAGGGKQIQQGCELFFVAPHPSGEFVIAANSEPRERIEARYPGVRIQDGQWAPDDFYHRVVKEAHASFWGEAPAEKDSDCADCD